MDPACSNKGLFFWNLSVTVLFGGMPMTALDKDQGHESASRRVWWFEGFWEEFRLTAPVAPYADYGAAPFRNLGLLSKEVKGRKIRFTPEHGPNSLFVSDPQRGDGRDFDDLGPMTMGAILVSGAMLDLLARFDLGDTQVLELPMYEGLGTPLSESSGLEEPDFSRPVPGRWGLLHVRARKSAVLEEKCVGVGHSVEAPWLDIQLLSVPSRSKKTVIALDAEATCAGVDLWFDERMTQVPFISDRLRWAIQDAGLRVPVMKWLKEAKLYTTPIAEDR